MVEEVFFDLHSVLPGAEVGQAVLDEVLKHLQGLGTGDGPAKAFQGSKVVAVMAPHFLHHRLRDGVGGKRQRRRVAPARLGRLPVFPVVVPAPAEGLGAVHEDAEAFAPLAIEVL